MISDLLELDIGVQELAGNLPEILREIKPGDYKGTYPPQRSYQEEILNSELLAFRWKSKFFGCLMYIKFTLKDDFLWLVSLHRDRENKK